MISGWFSSILVTALLLIPINDKPKGISALEVLETIKSNLTCVWRTETVDTFKSGEPNDIVSGIACTFTASIDVLKEAVARNCNLIITHEPTFYNHYDSPDAFKNDPVYLEKLKFIEDNDLIVFRFHDHWHMTNPDGIYVGMLRKFGWEDQTKEGNPHIINIPGNTVGSIDEHMQSIFPEATIRVIGNEDMDVDVVALSLGAAGFKSHHGLLKEDDVDLLIIGESNEWEIVEYVRDANQLGIPKALMILGHAVSEEAGMEYCAEWISTFISDIPVEFIPAGDPF